MCKNGLRDTAVPIVVAGRHLATLFLGQFFYEGEAPDRQFFLTQARAVGFNEAEYLAALDRVPAAKFTDAARSIERCVGRLPAAAVNARATTPSSAFGTAALARAAASSSSRTARTPLRR